MKLKKCWLLLYIALSFLIPQKSIAPETVASLSITTPKAEEIIVKKSVEFNPVLLKELVPICACESTGRKNGIPTQFEKDGITVKRGKINHHDIGMCQINETYHGAASKKIGMDIFTKNGNIKYANYLYRKEGNTPWKWSETCWR